MRPSALTISYLCLVVLVLSVKLGTGSACRCPSCNYVNLEDNCACCIYGFNSMRKRNVRRISNILEEIKSSLMSRYSQEPLLSDDVDPLLE